MNLIHPIALSTEVLAQCSSSTRDRPSTISPSVELLRQIHGTLYTEAGGDPTGIVQLHWNLVGFAPSWSFGSVTGRVNFVPNPERFTLLRLTAEIKGITRRLANEANRYGSGTGTVEVEGCVVPVRIEEQGRDETERKGEFYVLFVVDDPLVGETSKGNLPHEYPSGIPWGYFQPDIDDYEEEVYGAKLCLLILGWCGMADNRGEQTLGLILAEDGGDGPEPVYRRVGIFVGGGGFGGYTMSRWAKFGERKRLLLV
jgi:hypothetical protein